MNSVPQEVLRAIFEVGCDLEFEQLPQLEAHTEGRRRYFRNKVRSQRYLKSFLRPVLGVCKGWNRVIEETSALWVTTLFNASPWDLDSEEPSKIFERTHDDLVVTVTLKSDERSIHWFKDQILPFSHRIQKLHIQFLGSSCVPSLFPLLAKASFPRLLGLALKFIDIDLASNLTVDFPRVWAPKLRSLNVSHFPWSSDVYRWPFQNLFGLEITQDLCDSCGSASLSRFIIPSSENLVSLSITIPWVYDSAQIDNYPLHLLRLSNLSIYAPSICYVVHILGNIAAPALKTLYLRTSGMNVTGAADINAIGYMQFESLDFSSLKYIAIEMPADCHLHFFERLKAPNIEGLSMLISSSRLDDINMPPIPRIQFNKLRALHIDWKTTIHGVINKNCIARFFSFFDFSNASEHASVSLKTSSLPMNSRLDFPSLKKLSVPSIQDLSHVSVPSLQHLYVPFADLHNKNDWEEFGGKDLGSVPLKKITTLQLGMMVYLHHISNLNVGVFSSFSEVTTLLITHFSNFMSASTNVEYSWPLCWMATRSNSGWLNGLIPGRGTVLFPKLDTLQVALPEENVQESVLESIILEIEAFLQARRKQGKPVRKLSLNFIPRQFANLIDEIAEEVEEFRIVEYRHEIELNWIFTTKVWPL